MENNFDNLINKINEIESKNNSNTEIISQTLNELVKEYNINNSLVIKFKDLHGINQKFFNMHSTKNTKCKEDLFCVICQENIKSRQHKINLDKCNHCFHKKCLNKYLKETLLNFKCPNCKKDYSNNLNDIVKNL